MFSDAKNRFSASITVATALILSLLVVVFPIESERAYAAPFSNACDLTIGSGTSASPFLVSNADDLWEIVDCDDEGTTKYFSVTNDIDASSASATTPTRSPIGTNLGNEGCNATSTPSNVSAFSGILQGNGFSIFNVDIEDSCGAALFWALGSILGAETQLNSLTISGQVSSSADSSTESANTRGNTSAGLASKVTGNTLISNVAVAVSISAVRKVGGFIGRVEAGTLTISNSVRTEPITTSGTGTTTQGFVGGIVGYVVYTGSLSLQHVTNYSTIASAGLRGVGGLVGQTSYLSNTHPAIRIENSSNFGNISGYSETAGILGYSSTNRTTVSNVINNGQISARDYAGGIVGFADHELLISDATNSATVSATVTANSGAAGGILGGRSNMVSPQTLIVNSMNSGEIKSNRFSGGIVGVAFEATSLSGVLNSGAIAVLGNDSATGAGGLIGYASKAVEINSSSNTGEVATNNQYAGGFLGYSAEGAEILASVNTGNVSATNFFAGGLIGYSAERAEILASVNTGNVSATNSYAGGLIGYSDKAIEINSSSNTGEVATNNKYAGGFLGYSFEGARILASANTGNVTATNGWAGGLVGYVLTKLEVQLSYNSGSATSPSGTGGFAGEVNQQDALVTSSFNVGTVSGTSFVGGLIGSITTGSGYFYDTYNTGDVQGVSDLDGLVAYVNDTFSATSTYTSEDSAYASTSSTASLRLASTYVGFDFDTVWGFGLCQENNGYPMLRLFGQVTTYFSFSCGNDTDPNAVPAQVPASSQPIVESQAPAPTYLGPIVTSTRLSTIQGGTINVQGKRLDSVTSVEIGGVLIEVLARDENSITLNLPDSMQPGTYDLVITSGFGKLTVMDAVVITAAVSTASKFGDLLGFGWTGAFTGNSRTLNQAQALTIELALGKQPTATTIICWGYTTSSSPNSWAIAHATERAQAACNLVAQLSSDVKTAVRVRYGVKKQFAMRASLQFWELKPAP